MRDTIHLIGSEDVSRAGHNMSHAAEEMKRAASSIEDSLFRHQQFMAQWLCDLERILTLPPAPGETIDLESPLFNQAKLDSKEEPLA